MTRKILMLAVLWLVAGCTADNVQHGLYEGFRVRSDLQNSPAERIGKPDAPSYSEYQRLKQ